MQTLIVTMPANATHMQPFEKLKQELKEIMECNVALSRRYYKAYIYHMLTGNLASIKEILATNHSCNDAEVKLLQGQYQSALNNFLKKYGNEY